MHNQSGKASSSKHDPGMETWTCPCGQMLGSLSVDPITGADCLHIKVKDVTITVFGGPQSWIRRNCQRCGRIWMLTGKEDDQPNGVISGSSVTQGTPKG